MFQYIYVSISHAKTQASTNLTQVMSPQKPKSTEFNRTLLYQDVDLYNTIPNDLFVSDLLYWNFVPVELIE